MFAAHRFVKLWKTQEGSLETVQLSTGQPPLEPAYIVEAQRVVIVKVFAYQEAK